MKKIFCLILTMILIGSLLVIPISAADDYGYFIPAGEYLIKENVDFSSVIFPPDGQVQLVYFRFMFDSSDTVYYGFRLYRYLNTPGAFDMSYITDQSDNTVGAYSIGTAAPGWKSASYRRITLLDGFYTNDANFYSFMRTNLISVSTDFSGTFFGDLFSTFGSVGTWISGAADELTSMFYDGNFTFVGILVIGSLAISVSLLVISLISKFLRFRG